ncbi:MAG: alpha/beta hydrolase [Phycisphaerae bacterium]|nr:alpha/beta hydrolase [Phycisphaerae bacterium]
MKTFLTLALSILTFVGCDNSAKMAKTPLEVASMRTMEYKTVKAKDGSEDKLELHIFEPAGHDSDEKLPAIVMYFGGGWRGGHPRQFYPQAKYFASLNMVVISVEYRTFGSNGTTPFDCVEDGKSAIRFVRENADAMGIDPDRIIAAGGSAGGHVAACTGVLKEFDNKDENLQISSIPDAMILFNPVADTSPKGYGYNQLKEKFAAISPCDNISKDVPPTLILHGTADTTVPFENVQRFTKLMLENGNYCQLESFDGKGHGFFNSPEFNKAGSQEIFDKTMELSKIFLLEHGMLIE